ncbi:shikimate dehydrogenase [Virgibacillus oceani]|uniref:Shikimate dehydrogenase (NADP(+)) n=1 Tax=Virgibacillus oceani TaxID=1479511 RepID=A0A917LXZ1_9BACI|nr:shikimate dehydrogenase [Virgibacillus oceani]GGG63154.1 shikimate dehydrogenase (NADP(+)) [Virgibacillus oceani]
MNYQFALIGFPIKHSLSPWIHEQFLKKSGLNGTYSIIEIDPNEPLDETVRELKNSQINGFNVTVPYKKRIIPYLDELDEQAMEIGAVNTVVNRNGKWIGYNTDGSGYVRAFENKYPGIISNPKYKILLIGAGGAARGIYYALTAAGCQRIDIANRTKSSAEEIASLKKDSTKTSLLTIEKAEAAFDYYDIVIQTTSVGMKPYHEKCIVNIDRVKAGSVVSDIVYQPIKTAFLQQAEQLGARIHYGHTMLLYQAQYAFEIWTNHYVSIDEMDNELREILEGR